MKNIISKPLFEGVNSYLSLYYKFIKDGGKSLSSVTRWSVFPIFV